MASRPSNSRRRSLSGAKLSIDAELSATAKGETITVVAGEGGVEVNTQSQELSNVVRENRSPNSRPSRATRMRSWPFRETYRLLIRHARGTGFSINGQRSASTNILLDGGENVDTFTATVGQSVPLDSVQEFRVITSNFSAEYGRASGGIVNVATKAGTNAFTARCIEFNRVSAACLEWL